MSGGLYYVKYADHAVITGFETDQNTFDIPESIDGVPVTEISDNAFCGSGLTSIAFPKSVTTIGYAAFSMCPNLKSFAIPDTIESVGSKAFDMCENLTEVEFLGHPDYVGAEVFTYTPWLEAQRKKGDLVIVNGS